MNREIKRFWFIILVMLFASVAGAKELYFVDAHSQFDAEVSGELILRRMDEGGVHTTILTTRSKRKARDAAILAEKFPGRIVASVRTKSRHFSAGTNTFYKKIARQVSSGRFSAMAELLIFHAQKGTKAGEVRLNLNDRQVLTALDYALENQWPFILHIEFASLKKHEREYYMNSLTHLLKQYPQHPFVLIHMGQLPPKDVAALIKAHSNIYFLTSHADPVTASSSQQPWINMMNKDKFKPQWKELIVQHPDRFVFALDNVWSWQWKDTYLKHIRVWRVALSGLPDNVANAVAHGNAERLWKLQI